MDYKIASLYFMKLNESGRFFDFISYNDIQSLKFLGYIQTNLLLSIDYVTYNSIMYTRKELFPALIDPSILFTLYHKYSSCY